MYNSKPQVYLKTGRGKPNKLKAYWHGQPNTLIDKDR